MTGDHVQAALLLDQGASVNWISPNDYSTPLHVAASLGHESVVRLLLDRGASVNVEDNSNRTPLHGTALTGHQVLAALLLDRGASINAETRDNLTPLHCAAQGGHESVVRMLLDRGADTTIVSVRQCPCHCQCQPSLTRRRSTDIPEHARNCRTGCQYPIAAAVDSRPWCATLDALISIMPIGSPVRLLTDSSWQAPNHNLLRFSNQSCHSLPPLRKRRRLSRRTNDSKRYKTSSPTLESLPKSPSALSESDIRRSNKPKLLRYSFSKSYSTKHDSNSTKNNRLERSKFKAFSYNSTTNNKLESLPKSPSALSELKVLPEGSCIDTSFVLH